MDEIQNLKIKMSFDNRILSVFYYEGSNIEIIDIQKSYDYAKEKSGGLPFCILFDTRSNYEIAEEALIFSLNAPENTLILAKAYIIGHEDSKKKSTVNLHLTFDHPLVTPNIFETSSEATNWLKQFLTENDKVTLKETDKFQNSKMTMSFSNNILKVKFVENVFIEQFDIKTIYDTGFAYSSSKPFCILFDSSYEYGISEEAAKYIADNPYNKNILAKAYVVNTNASKSKAKLHVNFDKPTVLPGLFDNEFDALTWLKLKTTTA